MSRILTAKDHYRRAVCPACAGVGVLQEVRDGEGHEDECWACHGEGTLVAFLGTLAVGMSVEPGSAVFDG